MAVVLAVVHRLLWVLVRPLAIVLALAACTPSATPIDHRPDRDAGHSDAGVQDASAPPPPDPRFRSRLSSAADLSALVDPNGDGAIKFLAGKDGAAPIGPLTEPCYFQSARRFEWHIDLLRTFEGLEDLSFDAYTAMVIAPATRRMWGGAVRPWPGGVVTCALYGEELSVADVAEATGSLEGCAPIFGSALAFLPGSAAQKAFARASRGALEAAGVQVVFPEDLAAGVAFETYSAGRGFGTLRIVPKHAALADYGPRDVVIVEAAPNDIAVVAALITADRQSLHSHVNLRLAEKGIPSVAVPKIYEDALVASMDGQLVQVVASASGARIEPALLADAEVFWRAHRPTPPEVIADLTERRLLPFAELRADQAAAYGAKAANLGELHTLLDAEHRAEGFGVPLSAYATFMQANGLDRQVASMLADPRMDSDRVFKQAALSSLRAAIRAAPLVPGFFEQLQPRLQALGAVRIRFRSSTNVEDLPRLHQQPPQLDGRAGGAHRRARASLASRVQQRAAAPHRQRVSDRHRRRSASADGDQRPAVARRRVAGATPEMGAVTATRSRSSIGGMRALWIVGVLLVGCDDGPRRSAPGGVSRDAGPRLDARVDATVTSDGSTVDAGGPPVDASVVDASTIDASVVDASVVDGGAPSDAGATVPRPGRYFPDDAPWYRDVSAAPVDAESSAVIAWLDGVGFGLGRLQIDFSIEVLEADVSTPERTFTPTGDFYSPDCDHVPVPVPAVGAIEGETGYECTGDGDCHLLVVRRATGTLFEMWRANIQGGTFFGGCLAVWDMTRRYGPQGRGPQCTSADAAGFPITPLLFTADEVAAGTIDHAIRFILPNARMRDRVYVAPATHSTSATSGPASAPPYGARLRLRADFPLASLPNDGARVVARALMRYGMLLADGGSVALTARSDRFTANKWSGLLGPRDLDGIRPSDFDMIAAGPRIQYTGDCVRAP